MNCKRRICFFAHAPWELRKLQDDPLWLQQQLQVELDRGGSRVGPARRPRGV